ncbi:MAG: TonB-dependent receptor [Acidobacteria bacterium]|nr:TonB-dependent receptor [Acidobacteriota bacterium]
MSQRSNALCFLLVAVVWTAMGLMPLDRVLAQGEVTTVTLVGDVSDKTGAALPGAALTIKNQATGLARETTTNSSGQFTVSQLPAGRYDVSVELSGFKKAIVRDVELNVGATQTLRVMLDVGELVESVEITAEAVATIETTRTELGNVIQEVQVRELPLNQRSFTALVTQQAGLVQMTNVNQRTSPDNFNRVQGSAISAMGQMSSSVAYLMDGVNINNSQFGAPATAAGGDIPGVEAIQEFQVVTHNYSAAYGGSAGAVVSFATRGGTNNFYGSVYEFLRNDALDARGPFDTLDLDRDGQADLPPFRRNQFGATFGGPIKHDRTFFFANYEGLRQRLTTTDVSFVPSLVARNGGVGGSSGFPVVGPVRQPDGTYRRQPVAIPAAVRAILDLYPLPNGRDFGNGIAEHRFQNRQPIRQDFGLMKIDHNFSARDLFTARYSITDADGSTAFNVPTWGLLRDSRLQNLLLKWTRTIGPTLVNTASFSFVRSRTFIATSPTITLEPSQFTGNPARGTFGVIGVGALSGGNIPTTLTTLGNSTVSPAGAAGTSFPISDDLIYTRGAHTFKFGGLINRQQLNWLRTQIFGGNFSFPTLNDFLAGNPSIAIIGNDIADPHFGYRTTQFAWYVEDAWRAHRNLTITIGLRHEFQAPIFDEVNGKLGNFRSQQDPGPTVGDPVNNYTLKQFQPRLGIAYDPFGDGKTVIRAGVGLFNDFITLYNLSGDLTFYSPRPALNAFFGEPNAPDRNIFPPIEFPACSSCTQVTGFHGLLTSVLNPVKSPTSLHWNLQIERELPARFKFSVAYVGSQSSHVQRGLEANHNLPSRFEDGQPIFIPSGGRAAPAASRVAFALVATKFDTNASFHGLVLGINRRLSNGFTFDTSYSFGKAISESDAIGRGSSIQGQAAQSQYPADRKNDRAESTFSIRHRFTLNAVYELPFGKGKPFLSNAGGFADAVLGGWSLSTLGEFRSGVPFSVVAGFGITGVGDAVGIPDRPNILRANPVVGRVDRWFDPRAYALQQPGRLGNAPRNSVRGPDFKKLDFSLIKKFRATEEVGVEFRAEFFNILNHPNYDLPLNALYINVRQFNRVPTQAELDALPCNLTAEQAQRQSCNPQAGVITRTVSTPRQIQFGLKVTF